MLLSIKTDKILVQYKHPGNIWARHEQGEVALYIDNKRVGMTTTVAHKIGMAIGTLLSQISPAEMIVLVINEERVDLLPLFARRLMAVILRKADDADDWQLTRRVK